MGNLVVVGLGELRPPFGAYEQFVGGLGFLPTHQALFQGLHKRNLLAIGL